MRQPSRAMLDAIGAPADAAEWNKLARYIVASYCARGASFTTGEIRYMTGDGPSEFAVEGVLDVAAREGWILSAGNDRWRAAS